MKKALYSIIILFVAWIFISGTCSSESSPVVDSSDDTAVFDEVNEEDESSSQGDNKVFLVKSGKKVSKLTGMQNGEETVIWDNYGNDIWTETIAKLEMMGFVQQQNSLTIQTGGFMYNLDPATKSATKIKADMFEGKTGEQKREFGMEYIKQMNGENIGTEIVADKECDVWLIKQQGMEMKIWLWKGMTLKSVVNMGPGMEQMTVATSVDTEFDAPGNQFSLDGYTIKDMGNVQDYMNQY